VDALLEEGRFGAAKQRLRARIDEGDVPLAVHERYHRLLVASADAAEAGAHAQRYLRALLDAGLGAKAVKVYDECLALDRGFVLEDGHDACRVAEHAAAEGRPDLALRMLNRFSQRFPGHEDIPRAYLLAARLLCEHKGDDRYALRVLDGLLRQYPEHPLAPEMRTYRNFVERLVSPDRAAAS